MKILCRVTETGLVPLYGSDFEERRKLKPGETVVAEIRKPRNYSFHKKFFALIRLTFDNLPEPLHDRWGIYSEEDLLQSLKIDLGISRIVRIAGREVYCEGSISFAAMDNREFEGFYARCVSLILDKYLRGTRRQDLLDEVQRFL